MRHFLVSLLIVGCSSPNTGMMDASPVVCGCPDASFDPSPLVQRITQLETYVQKLGAVTNVRFPHLIDTSVGEDLGAYLTGDCSYSTLADGELCHVGSPTYNFESTDCTGIFYADMTPYRDSTQFIGPANTVVRRAGPPVMIGVRSQWYTQIMGCGPANAILSGSPMFDTGMLAPRRTRGSLAIRLQ